MKPLLNSRWNKWKKNLEFGILVGEFWNFYSIETKLLHNGGFTGAPVKNGCVSSIFLATDSGLGSESGSYFDHVGKKIAPCAESLKEEDQEKLWQISVEFCKKFGVWN